MYNLYGLSSILAGVASLAIAILVHIKGRGKMNRIWAIFAAFVAIYGFSAYMVSTAKNADQGFFWWRITLIGIILIPPLFLHFVYIFLGFKRPWIIRIAYLFTALFLGLDIFQPKLFIGEVALLFKDARYCFPLYWVYPPGPFYVFFIIFAFFGWIIYSHVELIIAHQKAGGIKRNQIRYFFLATVIGFTGGGMCFLPCFGIEIYPLSNFAVPVYPLIMTYAIIRHQLMDVEVIIKKTIIFAGLVIASCAVLTSFAYWGSIIFENVMIRNRWMVMAPSVFIIVLILRPLERFLRAATDKYLFQKKYDYRELLKTFTGEVLTVLNIGDLVELTVAKLSEIIRLDNAAIFLYDEEHDQFRMAAVVGVEGKDGYIFSEGRHLWSCLEKASHHVIAEKSDLEQLRKSPDFMNEIRELRSALLIPLTYNDNILGILSMGKEKSDERFTQDDIDILLALARTLSIAITNAQLFEKLSQAQAQAAQREKMAVIGTLSAGINHEICNPLGIVRGQCEMFLLNMKEGLYKDKTPEELVDKATVIMRKAIEETDRATTITRKLSAFARPARGKKEDDVSLERELNEVITLVEHDLKLDGIDIILDVQKSIPSISADRKQLQEVFFNLVRNAVQAIKGEGEINIKVESKDGTVSVDISDTGKGMRNGDLAQIFDPFFTTKDPGQGTGLGLFIVKQIVEKNNGHISVKTEPGKGTCFSLAFSTAE